MKSLDKLNRQINKIGNRLVRCGEDCEGIVNNPGKGIVPRCLILEKKNRKGRGVIIVGINPGESEKEEWKACRNITYKKLKKYWENNNGRYYSKLRKFADSLDFKGPILWTDLAKCEIKPNLNKLPLRTFLTCTYKYLVKEIEAAPKKWAIIANGDHPFEVLTYLYPKRVIIGIPHIASYGYFHGLFKSGRLKNKYRKAFKYAEIYGRKPPKGVSYKEIK